MGEYPICLFDRPRQNGFRQLAAEEPEIHVVEYLVEIIDFTLRRRDDLSPVRPLAIIRTFAHLFARDVRVVDSIGFCPDSPSQKFRDEYIRESSMRLRRHVATHVRNSYEDFAITNSNRLVQPDVRVVRDIDRGDGSISIEIPESVLVKTPDFFEWDFGGGVDHGFTKIIDRITVKMVSN